MNKSNLFSLILVILIVIILLDSYYLSLVDFKRQSIVSWSLYNIFPMYVLLTITILFKFTNLTFYID